MKRTCNQIKNDPPHLSILQHPWLEILLKFIVGYCRLHQSTILYFEVSKVERVWLEGDARRIAGSLRIHLKIQFLREASRRKGDKFGNFLCSGVY